MMQPQRLEAQPLVRPVRVGREQLARNLLLAPMAGVTNLPFRLIAVQAGAGLVFTETVSARGLVSGGARTWQLVESSPVERPLAYQLFGKDPENEKRRLKSVFDIMMAAKDTLANAPDHWSMPPHEGFKSSFLSVADKTV